ncbi:MAG TPA: asparagine--tRNA ligase, partial [Pasteurellaceae bacterium]|nr:asparagine--tRNA ligase [Pasteurellaceae bacterium]
MTTIASITDVLQNKVALGEKVTVRGWLRTRRDSKAGISFLTVYDGSCFAPIQVIVNNDIINYENEILRLTTGCAVVVTGTVV